MARPALESAAMSAPGSVARCLLAVCLLLAPSWPAGSAEPEAAPPIAEAPAPVRSLYDALLGAASEGETLGLEGRREQLAPVVRHSFDLDFMAARVLGGHWRTLSEQEKADWVDLFTRLTVASYAERFESAEGLRLEVGDVEPGARGTAVVRSTIHPPDGEAVAVDYRLRPEDGAWRIVDVYLDGTVSELALRRSEYGAVIDREGFAHLVSSLDERIREGKAAGDLPRG